MEAAAIFAERLASSERDGRIVAELQDRVLWLRIDRAAQHNALALTMLEGIALVLTLAREQLAAGSEQDWLRLVVITGSGQQSFAAGGDLVELDAMRSAAQTAEMTRRGMAALNAVRDFPLPVLAGLNGVARGGGAELAMACDWRIAHQGAGIGFIQGRLNLSPAWGGGTDLFRALGAPRALALLAEATVLSAADAHAQGLIERLLPGPASAFADALADYVAGIAERPPQILMAHKALALAAQQGADMAAMQQIEAAQLRKTWVHDDHWRAAAAALSK